MRIAWVVDTLVANGCPQSDSPVAQEIQVELQVAAEVPFRPPASRGSAVDPQHGESVPGAGTICRPPNAPFADGPQFGRSGAGRHRRPGVGLTEGRHAKALSRGL